MDSLLLSCLIVAAISASIGLTQEARTSGKRRGWPKVDVDAYLERYGYMSAPTRTETAGQPVQHSEEERVHAIRRFQKFALLPATGRLNKATLTKMATPRCGVADIYNSLDPNAPLAAYSAPGDTWPNSRVTWGVSSFTGQLPEDEQRAAFERAFRFWSDASGLSVTPVTEGKADIDIGFYRRTHGDRLNAFDGPGGILAHAFGPTDGRTHFDEDESWEYHNNGGTELETVAAHEFGHALGLQHSGVPGSLMAPFYRLYDPDFRLHSDDIAGIQALYGKPGSETKTTSTTTTPPTDAVVREMDPSECNLKFDAITRGPDGYIYAFSRRLVYKLDEYCHEGQSCVLPGFPKPIKSVYRKAPKNIAAVAYVPDDRKRTYFFKGKKIWRYTKFSLDKGYPKLLSTDDMPEKPHAAYVHKNHFADYQLYIFGVKHFWELNLYNEKMSNSKMLIRTYWNKMPHKPSAITQTRDGSIYVFKGKYYRKYDHYRSVQQPKRLMGPAWFGGVCGFSAK